MNCIFNNYNNKCKNPTTGKFCEIHRNKCVKLYKKYKNICNRAKILGECILDSLDQFSTEELTEYIKKFKITYIQHRKCYEERLYFSNICVHPDYRDKEHENEITKELNLSNICDNMLDKINKRINTIKEELKIEKQKIIEKEKEIEIQERMIESISNDLKEENNDSIDKIHDTKDEDKYLDELIF